MRLTVSQTGVDVIASFEEFCVTHHERLVRALALHCGDWHLAEELAEDTLVRAFERWNEVQEVGRPSAWLYRVGANLARGRAALLPRPVLSGGGPGAGHHRRVDACADPPGVDLSA